MVLSFGDWLKQEREARRLSIRDVARLSRSSATYLSNLENNIPRGKDGSPPRPSRQKAIAIAESIGASTEEALLASDRVPAAASQVYDLDILRLRRILAPLSPEKRKRIIDAVEMISGV